MMSLKPDGRLLIGTYKYDGEIDKSKQVDRKQCDLWE